MRKFILLVVLGIFLLPAGCKKDKDEPKPDHKPKPGEVVIADITKVMDASTRQAIAAIDTVNYTIVFNGQSDLLNNLKVGDILVDSCSDKAPYGYLRKVTKIEGTKSSKTVQTEQARLTDAVLQGNIDFSANELPLLRNKITKMVLAPGVTLTSSKNSNFTVFDFDFDMNLGDGNTQIKIDGNSSLDMGVFFKFDWTFVVDPSPDVIVNLFETGVEVNQKASINITSEAGASLNKEVELATFYFDPWTFSIGPVPVVFFPKVKLVLGLNGEVSAVFSAGASEEYHGALGLQYISDLSAFAPIFDNNFSYDYYAPTLNNTSNVKASVGPQISLMLYNVLGPYVGFSGYTKLDASYYTSTGYWDMDFNVGADATVGIQVDIFTFEHNWSTDFNLFEKSLIHLDNEPLETGIFFISPVDGNWYALGGDIKIQARVSGQDPDKVLFFADGVELGSADQEPFEYVWNTTGESHGQHTLIVKDIVNGEVIDADTAVISLLTAQWETVDFALMGQNNETINHDVYFTGDQTGYIGGGTGYGFGGYFLKSTDGGKTWSNLAEGTNISAILQMTHLNGDEFVTTMFSGSVFSSSDWTKAYGFYNMGGNWINTFDNYAIYNTALSFDGYLYAVGKEYANPDKYVLCKANTATDNRSLEEVIPITYSQARPKVYFFRDKGIVYNLANPANPLRLYYMISYDDGDTWETKPMNVSGLTPEDKLYDAFFVNETHGWIVGHDNNGYAIVLITKDGGDSWEKINVDEPYSFGSIWFINNNEGYATVNSESSMGYESYKLYHTQDGGYTWEHEEISMSQFRLESVNFSGSNRGFAVGQGTTGYRFFVE